MHSVQAACRPYSCGTMASPGCPRVGEVFTCLAFEPAARAQPLAVRRLHVGTMSGKHGHEHEQAGRGAASFAVKAAPPAP